MREPTRLGIAGKLALDLAGHRVPAYPHSVVFRRGDASAPRKTARDEQVLGAAVARPRVRGSPERRAVLY